MPSVKELEQLTTSFLRIEHLLLGWNKEERFHGLSVTGQKTPVEGTITSLAVPVEATAISAHRGV